MLLRDRHQYGGGALQPQGVCLPHRGTRGAERVCLRHPGRMYPHRGTVYGRVVEAVCGLSGQPAGLPDGVPPLPALPGEELPLTGRKPALRSAGGKLREQRGAVPGTDGGFVCGIPGDRLL